MTKHSENCTRVFKRYDSSCPRCQELLKGAAPREGWQADFFERKIKESYQRERAIKAHFAPSGPHEREDCGPVCTAFDW